MLFLVIVFSRTVSLYGQVIHNTGATISVASSTFVGAKDLENSSGTLGNDGTINLDGYLLNGGSINGDGFYNLRGNWTDNGSFSPGISTVTLYGTSDQTITHNSSGETFFNLTINNPGNTITQIANAVSTLGVLNDLNLTAGTLSLHSTTSYLTVGGKAVIEGSLIYNFATTQTASITGALSGAGTINMSGGNLPHLLNLGGVTNEIGTFVTGPGASTVNYNGTVPTQTVFAAPNYRNLIISNSGIKTLQGNSIVGIDLTISGGTFDLGTTTTSLSVYGNTSIIGSLSFNGTSVKTVSLTGNLAGSGSIDMSGDDLSHLMNLSGATNSIGSYTSGAGSLVDYIKNDIQTVFSSNNYRHLTISGSGTKTLLYGDVAASGILTMSAGDIDANGNMLKLTNSAIAALIRTDGKVIGKFQRAIGVTGSEYLYPLGAGAIYNPLKMTFQNLVPGPLTAQFKPDDIGTTGLPVDDDGNEIWDRYITGFWTLTAVAPMATSSFDVNLNHTGFGVVDASASVIKRTNGGNLEVDGEHGTLSASEITRTVLVNGISSVTTDLAIGKGRPRINAQPQNIDICELSNAFFEVTARGRGTLTYLWEVNTGSGWSTVTNSGVYSGATTDKLILTGAPYTMNGYLYRCTITDAQGHPNTTSTVLLTVNKIPIAVASPMTQNECPGIAFTDIVLGTSNDVTGTTFAWSRTNPGGISTTLGLTGSAINDKITGTFTNTLDAPITVTFTIIPTGPGTTFCIGNPIYVNVIVNPTAKVFATPANSTQCDSITTNIHLTSPSTFTSGSISFKYTVTATGSITGYTASVSGLPNNHTIADKLVNHTDVYQIVTYRVVPVSPVGCADGPAVDVKVTVNPTPRVIPVNLQPAICNGGATQIVLTSPTVMTSGAMRFDYTVSVTDGTVTGDTSPENDRIPGYNIARTYQNSSDDIKSVFFSITPKVSNAICVPGPKVVSEVKVHAIPLQDIVVVKPLTCSGGPGLAELRAVISNGASPYHIVWTGPVGYYSEDLLDIADLSSGKYIVKVTDNLGCSAKDSINIIPKSATGYISAAIIPPGNYNVSCIGSTDGKILVSVTGGITPPYTYRVIKDDVETLFTGVFTNNLNLSDPTTYHYYENLGSGTYTLVINDVNGCENIAKVTLKEPPVIVVEFGTSTYSGGYNVTCKGYNDGSASVNTITGGRGTYTYRWYTINGNIPGPVNTDRIDNLTAGKYYLETKDILNCVKIDSVVITEPEGMVLESSQLSVSADGNYNISCNGANDGFINMSISGGSGDYTYLWSSPNGFTATTRDISELKAGDYSCTVTDYNGCILTPSPAFTLTEPDPLVIVSTSSVSNDGAFNINCNGGTGSTQVTVTGGSEGSYVYTWTTTDGSGLIDGVEDQNSLTAGAYHLVVTDANNCVTTRDIILTQPPPFSLNISATNITCISPDFSNGAVDLTVSGGVGPFTYTWSNGAGTEDIDGLTEGEYQVTVTYNNTCSKTGTASIELPPPLTYSKIFSDYNGYSISCNGLSNGSIEITPITGEAPYTYSWTGPDGFASSSKDISNLRAGEYILLITDSNFCTATETFDLTEPGILGMNFDLSISNDGAYNINCAGDRTGAIGIEPLNHVKTAEYLWADGVFGKTRTNLPAGAYNVIITDANNCHAGSTVILTEPDSIKIVFDVTQPFCPDKPDGEIRLNVTGGVRGTDYTYKWSDNSNGKTNSDISGGLFSIRVSDLNGCIVKDSIIVEPLHETCLIIPNAISPNDDLINDEWNIGMIELYPQMEIKIFNRWGEIIWRSEKGYPRPWDGKSNGADLPIDSYHYIIDLHNGSRPLVGNVTIVR